MINLKFAGGGAAVAFAALLSAGSAQAAMSPALHYAVSNVERVDCAVGFHLGPMGACVIGDDEHHDHERVIERRATDEGCETRTVKRTDDDGDTETHTTKHCD